MNFSANAANIIVVAYHGDKWLSACVNSAGNSFTAPVRLMIGDNVGNTCIDELDLTGFDATVLRCPRPMGFAEANNFALLNGGMESEFVCFLNQDTVSRQAWLDACLAVLQADERVGAIMPLIENYDGTGWDEAFMTCARAAPLVYDRARQGIAASFEDLPAFVEVPEITAAAMVVRTEVLRKVGPFDPIYQSYYEDYDLCRRIAAAGYKVGICTQGRVGHFGGSVTTDRKAHIRRARWITRNRVIYAARWKWKNRPLGMLRYLATDFPRNLLRSALGRSNIPLQAYCLGHLDLIKLLPRLLSARNDRAHFEGYRRSIGFDHSPGSSIKSLDSVPCL